MRHISVHVHITKSSTCVIGDQIGLISTQAFGDNGKRMFSITSSFPIYVLYSNGQDSKDITALNFIHVK